MDEQLQATLSNVAELIRLTGENQLADANLQKEEVLTVGEEIQDLIAELKAAMSASESGGVQDALASVIEQASAVLDSAFVVIVNLELDAIKAAQAFGAIERAVNAALLQLGEQSGDAVSDATPTDRPNPLPLGKPLGELTAAQWELLGYFTPDFPSALEDDAPKLTTVETTEHWTEFLAGTRVEFDGGHSEFVLCAGGRGVFIRIARQTDLIGEGLVWTAKNSPTSDRKDAVLRVEATNPEVDARRISIPPGNPGGFSATLVRGENQVNIQTISSSDAPEVREIALILKDPDCESYLP
jgi:hypothetical protein